MLTNQSSSCAQAISWTWISPVTCEDRVRKHASWRPAGSICAAISAALRRNQIWPVAPTAIRPSPTATPMARSKLWNEKVT